MVFRLYTHSLPPVYTFWVSESTCNLLVHILLRSLLALRAPICVREIYQSGLSLTHTRGSFHLKTTSEGNPSPVSPNAPLTIVRGAFVLSPEHSEPRRST